MAVAFAGRSAELLNLHDAWRSANDSQPRVVGVTGSPGIGTPDVSIDDLATIDGLTGRDIKQSVIAAALAAARAGASAVDSARLLTAITAQRSTVTHDAGQVAKVTAAVGGRV